MNDAAIISVPARPRRKLFSIIVILCVSAAILSFVTIRSTYLLVEALLVGHSDFARVLFLRPGELGYMRHLRPGDRFDATNRSKKGVTEEHVIILPKQIVDPLGHHCLLLQTRWVKPGGKETSDIAVIYQDRSGTEAQCGVAADVNGAKVTWVNKGQIAPVIVRSPLYVGKTWSYSNTLAKGYMQYVHAEVKDRVTVEGPAGKFLTFLTEETIEVRKGNALVANAKHTLWFAPSLGISVKMIATESRGTFVEQLTGYKLQP